MKTLLIITAYIAPFLFIPIAFRFAGGIFANLTNSASKFGSGLSGRQRKYRGEARARNKERIKGGKLFKGGVEGANRRGKWNERAQKLAHVGNALDQGAWSAVRNPSTIGSNIKEAVSATEKHKLEEIQKDAAFQNRMAHDDVSGVAAGIESEDFEGLEKNLKKRGVGVKMKVDDDGNVTGTAEKDENGEYIVTDQAKIDAVMGRIKAHVHAGNKGEALKESLRATDTFTTRDKYGALEKNADGSTKGTNEAEVGAAAAAFVSLDRKHGGAALGRALVVAAGQGGTYYDNAFDTWAAAARSVKGDGNAKASMVGTFRQMLINAGRADAGGGSFGTTFSFAENTQRVDERARERVARGETIRVKRRNAAGDVELDADGNEMYEAERVMTLDEAKSAEKRILQREYARHVIGNTPVSTWAHSQMKENYAGDNLMSVLADDVIEAREAADKDGMKEGTASFDNYMRKLTEVNVAHASMVQSKPAMAQKMANMIIDRPVGGPAIPAKQVTEYYDDPSGLLGPNGKPRRLERTVQVPAQRQTLRSDMGTFKDTETWQKYYKEFYSVEERRKGAEEAAQRQHQPPPTGGAVPPVVPPISPGF